MDQEPESSPRRAFRPEAELLERIVAGESLRSLARELGVAHTTLARSLRRPEIAAELRSARQRLHARRAEERRAEKDLRRRARKQASRGRKLDARRGTPQRRRSEFEAWLDERDGPRGLSSTDRYSTNDQLAAEAVAAGGGIQELIETTGLRTRLGVYECIDPELVEQARANDARRLVRDPLAADTLRSLAPDAALISRRAAGEPLRRLAADYEVSASTLSRYFARPEVAEELRLRQREMARQGAEEPESDDKRLVALADHYASKIFNVWCPGHGRRSYVTSVDISEGQVRLEVAACCDEARRELLRWLEIHRAVLPTGEVFTPAGNAPASATVPPA